MNEYTPKIGAEITTVAYNGNRKTARCENVITGVVTKVTSKYIWVRNYENNQIWKAVK